MTASSPVEDKARTRESSGTWRLLHGEVARDVAPGGALRPSLAEVVVEQGVDEELGGFAQAVVQRGRWARRSGGLRDGQRGDFLGHRVSNATFDRELGHSSSAPPLDALTEVHLSSIYWTPGGNELWRLKEDDEVVKREKLGERIKRIRQARELGLRETAAKVGISSTYLSRIENCQDPTPPKEKVIRDLAAVLEDDFDELMRLAGRVPEDVQKVLKADPQMATFLRTARQQKVTGTELLEMLDARRKRGGR